MSIEDRANETQGQLPDATGGLSETSTDRDRDANRPDSQIDDGVAQSATPPPDTIVMLKDKVKEFRENPTPSFQEIESPNTTLVSTSTKVENLKAEIEVESAKMFAHSQDNSSAESSANGEN